MRAAEQAEYESPVLKAPEAIFEPGVAHQKSPGVWQSLYLERHSLLSLCAGRACWRRADHVVKEKAEPSRRTPRAPPLFANC